LQEGLAHHSGVGGGSGSSVAHEMYIYFLKRNLEPPRNMLVNLPNSVIKAGAGCARIKIHDLVHLRAGRVHTKKQRLEEEGFTFETAAAFIALNCRVCLPNLVRVCQRCCHGCCGLLRSALLGTKIASRLHGVRWNNV
jgi:hypothetical protein